MTRPPPAGDLTDHPLALIIGAAAARRFTGIIRLEHEGRTWSQIWRGGAVVAAESAHPEDQLGRVCVEANLIDVATLNESLRRMASTGKRQLDVLVQMGALTGENAQRAARLALARAATRPFGLTQASYVVDERQIEWAADELEPRWIVYRGLRIHYDEARLGRELQRLAGQAIKFRPEAERMQDSFGFADEERILIAYLQKGYWEPADLIDAAVSLARPVVMAVIYALYACQALDVQVAESVPRLRKRARETTHQIPSETAARANLPVTTPGQGSLPPSDSFSSAPTTGSFVRPRPVELETPYAASAPAASASPAAPAPAPAPPPAPARAPVSATPAASTSEPRASRSGSQLPAVKEHPTPPRPAMSPPSPGNPVGGKSVAAALREQILAKHRLIESGADHFAVLEVTRETAKDQLKTTYFQLAKTYHPDRLALVQLEDLRPQVERIFARLSEAYGVLGDDARREEYLTILSEGGEATVRARESKEAVKAVQILSAEEHFRRGEMALRRQAFPLALEEFKSALELNTEEGEHHAMYAWAVWCAAPDKDKVLLQVKRGLQRALELNAKCSPAFFFLGTVYKHGGDIDRAYAHFQKCVDLTPGNVDAEREIRLIEMRRERGGGSSGQKGIFDRFKKK